MDELSCAMNMVWTWERPIGVCLVFPSLQITGHASMLFYLIFLVLVSMGYEYSRLYAANLDKRLKETLRNQSNINGGGLTPNRRNSNRRDGPDGLEINTSSNAEDGLLNRVGRSAQLPLNIHTKRSLLYVFNIAISFWIMLIVMSFNAYIIGSILCGAFLGHLLFQREISFTTSEDDKGMACH